MKTFTAIFDRVTNERLTDLVATGESTAEEWQSQSDDDDRHIDTMELDGETVGIACYWA